MIQNSEFYQIIQNIFGEVHGNDSQLQVECPICGNGENKFNLEINIGNKRQFHCWSCCDPSFSGSLGRLIRTYGSTADYELYKSYAGSFDDYEFEEDEKEYAPVKLPEEMILFSQMDTTKPEHLEAYNYLVLDRKIIRDMILKYRLGFCISGKYQKRVIIPSYDAYGEVSYFVGRSYDVKEKRKYLNPISDKDKIIFNEGLVNWDSTVYLCEGVFDALSLPNAIPMLGKTISTTLYMKLKEMKPDIIVLLDPDAYKNSIELYYKLHTLYVNCEEKVRIVKLPTMEDIDELRRNQGIDEVIKSLRSARHMIIEDYFINKLQKPYDKRFYKKSKFNT